MTVQQDQNPSLPAIDGGEGVPPEPNWNKLYKLALDRDAASDCWRNVVNEMKQSQTLAVVNGPAIKRLVMFHVEFERQARDIARGGVVRKAKRTQVPQVHPAWSVMKQAAEAAAALEAELALSPRRRNNGGKIQRKEKISRAADRFLRPVSK